MIFNFNLFRREEKPVKIIIAKEDRSVSINVKPKPEMVSEDVVKIITEPVKKEKAIKSKPSGQTTLDTVLINVPDFELVKVVVEV